MTVVRYKFFHDNSSLRIQYFQKKFERFPPFIVYFMIANISFEKAQTTEKFHSSTVIP